MSSYDFRRNFFELSRSTPYEKAEQQGLLPVVWSDNIASKWKNWHFWLNGSIKQWPRWDFSMALMRKIKANDSVWIRGSPWLRAALWELADPIPAAPWTGSDDQLDNGHILNTTRLGSPPPPAVIGDSLLTTGRARLQFLWSKALLPSKACAMLNRASKRHVAKKQPPLIHASLSAAADVNSSRFLMVRRKLSQILSFKSTDGRHLKSRPMQSVSELQEMHCFW